MADSVRELSHSRPAGLPSRPGSSRDVAEDQLALSAGIGGGDQLVGGSGTGGGQLPYASSLLGEGLEPEPLGYEW